MDKIAKWDWEFDDSLMVCRNAENDVIVNMEKVGNTYIGRLNGLPMALIKKITGLQHGERIIKQIIRSAEMEFSRVHWEEIELWREK